MFDDDDNDGVYVDEDHERQVETDRRAKAFGALISTALLLALLLTIVLLKC